VAVVVSLGVHAVVVALLATVARFDLPFVAAPASSASPSSASASAADDDRPIEIQTIVNQLDRPEERTLEEKRREEEAKKEEEAKDPHGQVVDIARPLVEERPDKADYVSEYDSKVEQQTKGPSGRDRAGAPKAPPSAGEQSPAPSANAAPPPLPEGRPDARPGRPGPLAMREPERPAGAARARGLGGEEARQPDGELVPPGQRAAGERDPARRPSGPNGEDGTGGVPGAPRSDSSTGRPNLVASRDMLERAIGKGAGSMDYLKDVDDGESTALNAKKWKHAPFFNRVKRAVANEWHPEVVYVQHDPSGNVYGVKDRVTVLRVHLLPDGKLAAWTVLQSSGVDFLDDEAIDAFRKAGPFPNPPRDLVETDGQIHFNFAFIFELSGHTSFKVFKYQ
jgi:TonB family protein